MMEVLGRVLKKVEREITARKFTILSDAEPVFHFRIFLKTFFYHVIHLMLLGPFAYLIVLCGDGHYYAANLGMGIIGCTSRSKTLTIYKLIDTLMWLGF